MKLPQEEYIDDLKSRINQEGFHYCFVHYHDWKEIKDPGFHGLRRKYLDAAKELEDYIENQL